jgi:hypothetical protein
MQTFTITFGDQAENHKGMQKIGELAEEGFSFKDLKKAEKWFDDKKYETELYKLHKGLDECEEKYDAERAYILVVRNGLSAIVNVDEFFEEQEKLEKDKKAFMYGRVVNKHARHNLCFADEAQEPNYEDGQGTIVAFEEVPLLEKVRKTLPKIIGDKAKKLMAEGNYYYDVSKCGIGFHGDSERKKVIAVRIGETMPLHYQWYYKNERVGRRIKLKLHHGDIYFMSEKATGFDWKLKNKLTLRHAAGSKKFLK